MGKIEELSQKGRALKQRVSKLADESDGVWRTIQGRAIFIPTGGSVEDAMKKGGAGAGAGAGGGENGGALTLKNSASKGEKLTYGDKFNPKQVPKKILRVSLGGRTIGSVENYVGVLGRKALAGVPGRVVGGSNLERVLWRASGEKDTFMGSGVLREEHAFRSQGVAVEWLIRNTKK